MIGGVPINLPPDWISWGAIPTPALMATLYDDYGYWPSEDEWALLSPGGSVVVDVGWYGDDTGWFCRVVYDGLWHSVSPWSSDRAHFPLLTFNLGSVQKWARDTGLWAIEYVAARDRGGA